jgi:peptidoglycan-N-acetylglucosamine deacetylase
MPAGDKVLYLTFDDGPHPDITGFVLDELKKYKARATFFCLGKNVVANPGVYKRIIDEGHAVGNHTFNHLDGWKTKDSKYLSDIREAANYIDSSLYRPPYGRITDFQVRQLLSVGYGYKIIMWSTLSGDFDKSISKEDCFQNVLLNSDDGSIIVFHDSEKARERMSFALPRVLEYFSGKGYRFEKI